MENTNEKIKISGIIYILNALFVTYYNPPWGLVLLTMGIIILANSFLSPEALRKNRAGLIILVIVSFIINIPSAIFLLLGIDEIKTIALEKSNAPPTSAESRKIDILLKLGLAMILISGILFATTSWESISNIFKLIFLVGVGFIFLFLSIFSEKRLKIESTTKAYFVLSLAFFFLTWVGIAYFGLISPWLSYTGAGKALTYAITAAFLGILLYLMRIKFGGKEFLLIGHASIYLALYYLLTYLDLNLLKATLVLEIVMLVINILPNIGQLKSIKEITCPLSYSLFPLIIIGSFVTKNSNLTLVACLINIINNLYVIVKKKEATSDFFATSVNYILLILLVSTLKISFDAKLIVLILSAIIYSLLVRYQKLNENKLLKTTSQIIFHIIATLSTVILYMNLPLGGIAISALYLLVTLINSHGLFNTDKEIDFAYQGIVMLIFTCSLTNFIAKNITLYGDYEPLYMATATVLFAIFHQFTKEPERKKYYFVATVITLPLTIIANIYEPIFIVSILTLLVSIYIFSVNNTEKIAKQLTYILILFNITQLAMSLENFGIPPLISTIINLSLFGIIALLVKDKKLKIISYFSILLPLYNLTTIYEMEENLNSITINILYIYSMFLIVKNFIKSGNTKDLFASIALVLIMLPILFEKDLLIGIYIGIVSLLAMFYTFLNSDYKKLFYCGIILSIINIINQLWELWLQIPFWLYLLLAGVLIIIFVTYKEMHKDQEPAPAKETKEKIQNENKVIPSEDKEKLATEEESTVTIELAKFCPACGTKNENGKFCRNCGKNLKL